MLPSATFLGFIATFISLTLSYGLASVRPYLLESAEFVLDYVLLFMVFGMALRHQLRVVFMDNFYVTHCDKTENWRIEFWLVLLISALGGIILTVFFYGGQWISSFMVFYCVMFAFFGFQVFRKMMSSIEFTTGVKRNDWPSFPREMWPVSISLFVDVVLFILWIYWCATIVFDELQVPNAIDIAFALVLTGVVTFVEYLIVFRQPVKQRFGDAKKMLKTGRTG